MRKKKNWQQITPQNNLYYFSATIFWGVRYTLSWLESAIQSQTSTVSQGSMLQSNINKNMAAMLCRRDYARSGTTASYDDPEKRNS